MLIYETVVWVTAFLTRVKCCFTIIISVYKSEIQRDESEIIQSQRLEVRQKKTVWKTKKNPVLFVIKGQPLQLLQSVTPSAMLQIALCNSTQLQGSLFSVLTQKTWSIQSRRF